MQHDEVALSDHTLDIHPLAGIFPPHSLKIFDDSVLSVCDVRVVCLGVPPLTSAAFG
jgi:hypothetical protein